MIISYTRTKVFASYIGNRYDMSSLVPSYTWPLGTRIIVALKQMSVGTPGTRLRSSSLALLHPGSDF